MMTPGLQDWNAGTIFTSLLLGLVEKTAGKRRYLDGRLSLPVDLRRANGRFGSPTGKGGRVE
jgi:hypothetical protein